MKVVGGGHESEMCREKLKYDERAICGLLSLLHYDIMSLYFPGPKLVQREREIQGERVQRNGDDAGKMERGLLADITPQIVYKVTGYKVALKR